MAVSVTKNKAEWTPMWMQVKFMCSIPMLIILAVDKLVPFGPIPLALNLSTSCTNVNHECTNIKLNILDPIW